MRTVILMSPIDVASGQPAPAQTIVAPSTPTLITSISGFTLSPHCDRMQLMNIGGGAGAKFYVGPPSGSTDKDKRNNMFCLPPNVMLILQWDASKYSNPGLYLASDAGDKVAVLQETR